jgi:adenylate cyclase
VRIGWQLTPFWLGRTRRARWERALLVAILLPLLCAALAQMRFISILELKTQDVRFRLRQPPAVHPDLLVVEIDDETIQRYGGQFPLERDQHGVLLDGLRQAGAASIGFDLLFTTSATLAERDQLLWVELRSSPGRAVLAAHFFDELSRGQPIAARRDTLLNPYTIPLRPGTSMPLAYAGSRLDMPLASFLPAGVGVGQVTLLQDLEADGSFRRVPLVIQTGGRLFPTLALVCWMQARHLAPPDVVADPLAGWIVEARSGRRVLRLPRDGLHEINYVGDRDAFLPGVNRISFIEAVTRIKSAAADPSHQGELDVFKGKIVLVGVTGAGSYSLDFGMTPVSASMPLLYVHANLLNDLLQGCRLTRLPLRWPLLAAALVLLFGSAIGPTLKSSRWFWLWLAVLLGLLATAHLAFTMGRLLVPVVAPTVALLLGYLIVTSLTFVGQESERQILRSTFQKYVSRDLLEGILADAGRIQLGGSLKQSTVVFVDIRGFTAWTRTMEPGQLVDELNGFLSEMVEVIFALDGTVNKFLGDAILAVFGAPIERPDDPQRAVEAARRMQERLAAHNEARRAEGKPPIKMGIAIATGSVVAGNVGSSERLEYTVIGNTVNLAARLQALSLDGQILLDRRTALAVDGVSTRSLGPRQLKGIDEPIEVFEILAPTEGPGPPLVAQ